MNAFWERIKRAVVGDFPYEADANLSRLDRLDGRDA
jgi:hypothetical protein